MTVEIQSALWLALSIIALFCVAEILYHRFSVKAEYTRKLVHFGTGALTLLFPALLNNAVLVILLCVIFSILVFLSLKYNFFKSIHDIDRVSHGGLAYPFGIFCCFLFYLWYKNLPDCRGNGLIAFYLPLLILSVSDPVAALAGKRWPFGKYRIGNETKSLMGSFMFFLSTLLVSYAMLLFTNNPNNSQLQMLISSVLIALLTVVSEGLSKKGFDNISIPVSAIISFCISACFILKL